MLFRQAVFQIQTTKSERHSPHSRNDCQPHEHLNGTFKGPLAGSLFGGFWQKKHFVQKRQYLSVFHEHPGLGQNAQTLFCPDRITRLCLSPLHKSETAPVLMFSILVSQHEMKKIRIQFLLNDGGSVRKAKLWALLRFEIQKFSYHPERLHKPTHGSGTFVIARITIEHSRFICVRWERFVNIKKILQPPNEPESPPL